MTVYNGGRFLREAIESCLNQTYTNLELIIIDDGSLDNSLEIIKSFEDKRIRLIINEANKGQSYSRNKGIKESSGEYIAVMDADDVAYLDRIEKQVNFLLGNKNISIIGSFVSIIDEQSKIIKTRRLPVANDDIKVDLIFNCPLVHSSVMWRKCDFEYYDLSYSLDFVYAQDMELWSRVMFYLNFSNIPEPLVYSRFRNKDSITSRFPEKQGEFGRRVVETTLRRMGIPELIIKLYLKRKSKLYSLLLYFNIIICHNPEIDKRVKLKYFYKRFLLNLINN